MVTGRFALAPKYRRDEDSLADTAIEEIELDEENLAPERLAKALEATISGETKYLEKSVLVTIGDVRAAAIEAPPARSAEKILAVLDESVEIIETRIKRAKAYIEGEVNADTVAAAEHMARARFERMSAEFNKAKTGQDEAGLAETKAGVKDAALALLKIKEDKESL